jgi:hypothetical protein
VVLPLEEEGEDEDFMIFLRELQPTVHVIAIAKEIARRK